MRALLVELNAERSTSMIQSSLIQALYDSSSYIFCVHLI